MNTLKNIFSSFYWKISVAFLFCLLVLGVAYAIITAYSAEMHFIESNQRLHKDLAGHIAEDVKPLIGGEVQDKAVEDILHSMMVINPGVEVYLLDAAGKILHFVAPDKKDLKLKHVPLEPLKTFIASNGNECILGHDPRNEGCYKAFSAAPILENEALTGYVYVVLASEEYDSVAQMFMTSYMLRVGIGTFFLTLLGAFLLGLFLIWYLTRTLRDVSETVQRFGEGKLDARLAKTDTEFAGLSNTFNKMADTIVANMEARKNMEKLRRELIGNVSHDLRTPITVISGYVETLMMKKEHLTEEEQHQYIEVISKTTQDMEKLVGQLFELSKLDARQVEPKMDPFFIAEVAQDVFLKYKIIAEEKGISLSLDMPKDVPMVRGDISLLERVVQNLLDNAIKFTPKGGTVKIWLKILKEEVCFKITDTGPGISKEEQEHIFERYYRAEGPKKGGGLGLAIAKKILDLHEVNIILDSTPGKGTTFRFELPIYIQSTIEI